MESVLVALDPRLKAASCFSMDTAAHDADIQQVGVGGHKGVDAGVQAGVVDDPCAVVIAAVKIKAVGEAVLLI